MQNQNLQWHIGCSGFHYPEWKGIFYPEALARKNWFQYYCQHFNTLELNVTFYRFPQLKFLQTWYDTSPENFLFSVKVPRLITHYKQFNETENMLNDFYSTCIEGLRNKLGCVLFQLPSHVTYSEEALEKIMAQLNYSFMNVVEFRHSSWWKKKVYDTMARHRIIFCSHSYPELPNDVVANSSTVYYRFHGEPVLYYSQYKRKFIEEVVLKIQQSKKTKQSFIYFNNTATIGALRNAAYLQKLVQNVGTTS